MISLAPETEARMDAFHRALAWGDHFRLILVSAPPGPARDEILERLRAWSGRDGIPVVAEVNLTAAERPVAAIRRMAQALAAGSGIVLVGLDQYLARDAACGHYENALALYSRIPDPCSVGVAHLRLAKMAPGDAERNDHLSAARAAWLSIGRLDLVEELDRQSDS